jgi:5-methylcytosine-specific restriction endonuclease McrBC GTP-binding regulatory subunit McrB
MKSIKTRIYFDSWRRINETLFLAYISCYNKLAKDKSLEPAEELSLSLKEFDILGKYKKKAYGSAYIPARELGIFYNDPDGHFVLGENAKKFIAKELSYEEYMKAYVLNYQALINNKIISPFKIIRDHSLINMQKKTIEEIFENCKEYFSDGKNDELAEKSTYIFIGRAVESGLIKKDNKTFEISEETIYDINFFKPELLVEEFSEKYLVGSKEAQKNYVKEMINQTHEFYSKSKLMKYPLNQILYGPPGTGKTYSTITKALDIIGLEYNSYEEAQELFQNELGKRIEFVTMHQSFSYEDFVQGLKPLKPKKGEGVIFDYKNGVFKEICRRANLKNKEYDDYHMSNSKVDFDLVIEFAFKDLIENDQPVTIERGNTPFKIHELNDQTLWFETSKGTKHERYTLAKKTLKAIYEEGENKIITSGNKGYFDAALDYLNKKSVELQKKLKTKLKPDDNRNFVIILDEINRANISRVFGELIALIEKDKRDGKLTATLPSGEAFTVPSNLHIIGTMNTADKSIALVDIALRRRFEFKALYPDPNILKNVLKENGFSNDDTHQRVNMLTCLNRIIRAKKSVDFEIGHSYFMDNDTLVNILNKQVLPLLNEYFMYDLKRVKEIIEKTQKDKEGEAIPKPGIIFNNQIWKDRGLLKVERIKSAEDNLDVVETDETSQD